jgi:hypothetical protein
MEGTAKTATLALASLLVLGSVGCAQYPRPYPPPAYAPPAYYPPPSTAPRQVRVFDRGYQEGYRAGFEHRGGSGAPGWMTDRMYGEERREFRRGYHDGFNKGKWDRRHGVPPAYR